MRVPFSLQPLKHLSLVDNSPSNRCEVVSHGSLDLHFPDSYAIEQLFLHLFTFVCLLGRGVCSGSLSIFHSDCLVLSFRSPLYILDIKPLSELFFANIISHSVGFLIVLLSISFVVQKFFFVLVLFFFLFNIVLFIYFLPLLPLPLGSNS